jgi:hypothetical protein
MYQLVRGDAQDGANSRASLPHLEVLHRDMGCAAGKGIRMAHPFFGAPHVIIVEYQSFGARHVDRPPIVLFLLVRRRIVMICMWWRMMALRH